MPDAIAIIVIGPAGVGKTTLGRALAVALGWEFIEADEFHPPANIEKMRQGIGLTDADRLPWLRAVRAAIDETQRHGDSVVVACSALKQVYREVLTAGLKHVHFVYLSADRALLEQRLAERAGHFAGPALVSSQLDALEEPGPEALTLNASTPIDELISEISAAWNLVPRAGRD